MQDISLCDETAPDEGKDITICVEDIPEIEICVECAELLISGTATPIVGSIYTATGGQGAITYSFDKGTISASGEIETIDPCGDPGTARVGIVSATDSCVPPQTAQVEVRLPGGSWVIHSTYTREICPPGSTLSGIDWDWITTHPVGGIQYRIQLVRQRLMNNTDWDCAAHFTDRCLRSSCGYDSSTPYYNAATWTSEIFGSTTAPQDNANPLCGTNGTHSYCTHVRSEIIDYWECT